MEQEVTGCWHLGAQGLAVEWRYDCIAAWGLIDLLIG